MPQCDLYNTPTCSLEPISYIGDFDLMTRPKLTNRRNNPNRPSTMFGAACLGLAVLIMVAIVGAVYWANPANNNGTPQMTTKPSPKAETTGSGGVH